MNVTSSSAGYQKFGRQPQKQAPYVQFSGKDKDTFVEQTPNSDTFDTKIDSKKEQATTLLSEQVANWWATRLQASAFEKLDNGATDPKSLNFRDMMATGFEKKPAITAQQIEAFKGVLQKSIRDQLMASGASFLRVDYRPDNTLKAACQAAEKAGNGSVTLPLKSQMVVELHNGTIKASLGPTGTLNQIYTLPGEFKSDFLK